jgi:CubicO group peptidase (beta-lactamase class C family)
MSVSASSHAKARGSRLALDRNERLDVLSPDLKLANQGTAIMRNIPAVLVVLGLVCPFGDAIADAANDDVAKLDGVFARWNAPDSAGCSVGVEQDGRIIALRAYGSADLEHAIANTPATVFEVGSVSKQFTAAAILMLVEDGRLALTDDIRKYLLEMPDYGSVITIDHLLTHTSGLRDWGFLDELAGWGRLSRISTNADVLDVAARQRTLNHAPGGEYSYTNTGYGLLATIVERVSGQTLPAFTNERVFRPLKMTSTQWRDDYRRIVPRRAVGYRRYGDGPWFKWMGHENVVGDSGILTTVEDLLTWNAALRSGALGAFVSRELVRTATLADGTALTYARGLEVGQRLGTDAVWHLGGMFGYRAALGRYAERALSIAILCNAGDIEFGEEALLEEVAAQFLTSPATVSPAAGGARLATSHAGLYVNERSHMPLRIVSEAGALRVEGRGALKPLSSDRFTVRGGEGQFSDRDNFRIKNANGVVDSYRRVAEPEIGVAQIGRLTGDYYSTEAGATFRIAQEGGQLVLRIDRRPDFRAALRPAYTDAFVYDTRFGPGTAIIRFMRNSNQQVSAISVGWNLRVRDLRFDRIGASGN